jgi:hypothetical protein
MTLAAASFKQDIDLLIEDCNSRRRDPAISHRSGPPMAYGSKR